MLDLYVRLDPIPHAKDYSPLLWLEARTAAAILNFIITVVPETDISCRNGAV